MAERRMFAKSIINSARFLRMPVSSRLLYYDLGMQADDDGVVEAFAVMRATGATEDDLRVLASKGFIKILNDDLVSVITDWSRNNLIKKDRYKKSVYSDLLVQFGIHTEYDRNTNGTQMEPVWNPNGTSLEPQVRLGKDRLGKDNDNSLRSLSCSEPSCESTEPATAESTQDAEVYMLFPTNIQNPKKANKEDDDPVMFPVKTDAVERFKELYPAVDVDAELKKALSWCWSNRSNRKTASGMMRFLNRWLSREQDRGGYAGKRASPANAIERENMADGVYDLRRMK